MPITRNPTYAYSDPKPVEIATCRDGLVDGLIQQQITINSRIMHATNRAQVVADRMFGNQPPSENTTAHLEAVGIALLFSQIEQQGINLSLLEAQLERLERL